MIGYEVCFTRWSYYKVLLIGKNMAGLAIGPRSEPSIVALLNVHSSKLSLNFLSLSPQASKSLKLIIEGFYFFSRWRVQGLKTGQHTEKKQLEFSFANEASVSHPFSKKLRVHHGRGNGKTIGCRMSNYLQLSRNYWIQQPSCAHDCTSAGTACTRLRN